MTGTEAARSLVFPDPPIIAILRAGSAHRFGAAAEVLCEAGIRVVELTLTTPGALEALAGVRDRVPADVVLGMGSVLTTEDVDASLHAGAQCLFTPMYRPDVIARAVGLGIPIVAGAATPTEIFNAYESGASAVKVFPASQLGGPGYLRAVRAPLPAIPLLPTGGIGVHDVGAYLRAGAAAVGLGGPLLGDALKDGGDLEALAARTREVVASSKAAKA
ncbi:MAG: 2-dehydro-3-deoxyphosphogluconate aldolase [Actinoallomurus sp.]|nr:2-dehydro-3-deoxyphosphogluconate aldolase [Actinoallomurus sp.]